MKVLPQSACRCNLDRRRAARFARHVKQTMRTRRAAYFAHGAIVAHKGKDIVVNVSAPTVGAYEWCTLPLHAYTKQRTLGFGRGSLAVSPDFDLTQEIAVGWPEGGMLMAQVKRLPDRLCRDTLGSHFRVNKA